MKSHQTNKNSSMKEQPSLLVFTDLDGTLLEHDSYSYKPALPALSKLKRKGISLIICTSKTRAEIEEIRVQLQNTDPFISENGGAIFIPRVYFQLNFPYTRAESKYFIIELGTSYQRIRAILTDLSDRFPGKIRGFGDLSVQEIANLCNMSLDQAQLAKIREYDEPFILNDAAILDELIKVATDAKLQITRGGRFYHLTGGNDKGKAILLLKDIYRKKNKHIQTIGCRDSQNDAPMLKVVDHPVLVQKPNGIYDASIQCDNLILAPGTGPIGWNAAVIKLLDDLL